MSSMDDRLRNHFRSASPLARSASPRSAPSADDPDFNLLSRHAEGVADKADHDRIARLSAEQPAFAELVEELAPGHAVMPDPAVIRFPRVWRVMALAASTILVAGAGWLILSRTSVIVDKYRSAELSPMVVKKDAMPKTSPAPAVPKAEPSRRADTASRELPVASEKLAAKIAGSAEPATTATPASQSAALNNTYALLIGVDRNENDARIRNGALADVRQVATKLAEFQFNRVIVLTNEMATRAGIGKALASVQREAGSNVSLFVYCAGDAPGDADVGRNGCVVPFDNPTMVAGKNMAIESVVATSAPGVFNNGFVVYDNRLPRSRTQVLPMQSQQLNQLARNTMNIVSRPAAANVQVLVNVNDTAENVSNLFATAFVQALDQSPGNDAVSADEVEGYVNRQQTIAAAAVACDEDKLALSDEAGAASTAATADNRHADRFSLNAKESAEADEAAAAPAERSRRSAAGTAASASLPAVPGARLAAEPASQQPVLVAAGTTQAMVPVTNNAMTIGGLNLQSRQNAVQQFMFQRARPAQQQKAPASQQQYQGQ